MEETQSSLSVPVNVDASPPNILFLDRVARPFGGLIRLPRRRRVTTGNNSLENGPSIPLYTLGEDSNSTEQTPSAQPSQQLVVEITINRICRVATILVLGFWGGWSPMPEERKTPVSVAWVAYICLLTDWIAVTAVVDCVRPNWMNWYFRESPEWRILVKENARPRLAVTGYGILNTVIGLGYALFKYMVWDQQALITRSELVVGGIVFTGVYWLGRLEGNPQRWGAWFFHDDYGPHLAVVLKFILSLFSWWWIFFRIVAIVNILRNRHNAELSWQFHILVVGLAIEGFSLFWFLFIVPILPHFFKSASWDREMWGEHAASLLFMFIGWLMVVVIGLREDIFNLFFPCSSSTGRLCRFLISYL